MVLDVGEGVHKYVMERGEENILVGNGYHCEVILFPSSPEMTSQ
jgi:hypothetical protein